MDEKKVYNVITGIDDDLIDKSVNRKAQKTFGGGTWLRVGAIAACFILIAAVAVIAVPGLLKKDRPINRPSNTVPAVSAIKSGVRLTGMQELAYGENPSLSEGAADMMPPGFYIRTVIEAEVVEVLPDTYFFPDTYYYNNIYAKNRPYHVAKLRVIDQIRGDGLPAEIYLRYPYYDTTVFDGYERFIMSVDQIGTDNYALVNGTQARVDFFPNMFCVFTGDLGYGSVIAFNGGRVDSSFWNKTDYYVSRVPKGQELFNALFEDPESNCFPAARNETIANVKSNIVRFTADSNNWRVLHEWYDYVTADDVFTSPEAKAIKSYLEPGDSSVFVHNLSRGEDRLVAKYTRIINGFLTDETIVINGYDVEIGGVSRSKARYTEENLSKVPDIGKAIESIDLSKLVPPHIKITEGVDLVYSNACGVYRNINGKVYGIVRVTWYYSVPEQRSAFLPDDLYYLYDEDGNGSIVEREELRELIGDDGFIQSFLYGSMTVVNV